MMMAVGGARVLVVEDDERVRGALCDYLEELGYTPEAVADGGEALARLETTDYRLVVTDYRMPGLNGLDVVRSVRASRPALPLLIVSGYVPEFAWQARALGIPVVAKPVDFGVFARVVEGLAGPR